MYTLYAIAWIICIIQAVFVFKKIQNIRLNNRAYINPNDQDESSMAGAITAFIFVCGAGIGLALVADIYGPSDASWGAGAPLILAFTTLGVMSLSNLFISSSSPRRSSNERYTTPDFSLSPTSLVFNIIGLIGSVLGIISFYLDYLK